MAGAVATPFVGCWAANSEVEYPARQISDFCRRLRPVGRILEMEDWYVWGTSPIDGADGKVHVFFSRWPARRRMGGWVNRSEVAHAVADKPEGPYEYVETVLRL
jgi:hypothetical protein